MQEEHEDLNQESDARTDQCKKYSKTGKLLSERKVSGVLADKKYEHIKNGSKTEYLVDQHTYKISYLFKTFFPNISKNGKTIISCNFLICYLDYIIGWCVAVIGLIFYSFDKKLKKAP